MKMMTLAACALVTSAAFAEVLRDEGMQKAADDPQVQKELEADGVCLHRDKGDGSLQVIARGSANYSFGTSRDVRNKTKVAELDAKQRLVSFMKGQLAAYAEVKKGSKETNAASTDGSNISMLSTAEEAEMFSSAVRESVSGTLTGVVVLKTVKTPDEGSKTSGMIQVTVGYSMKTLAAAAEAHNMISDSMNARRTIGNKPSRPNAADCKEEKEGGGDTLGHNKHEVRTNDTLF